MVLRAKVNVETAKRSYKAGETIDEQLCAADVAFLKKYGFVEELVGVPDMESGGREAIDGTQGQEGDRNHCGASVGYMDEAALRRLNKDKIREYAESIGLNLATDMPKNDMVDAVLNHIGEQMAEMED